MKKLILTACAATLFCIGSMAQDSTSINNNLRQGAQEAEERTEDAGNQLQQAGDSVKQDAQDAGNELRQGAERTGSEIEQGANEAAQDAKEAGQEVQQGAEQTGNEIKQGAEKAGTEMEQGAERAKDKMEASPSSMDNSSPNAMDNQNTMSSNEQAAPAEIEVLEEKEGPNSQVVYKYQGGLYYVDRDQKQLVKIEESQLKDAEHKAVVSNSQKEEKQP